MSDFSKDAAERLLAARRQTAPVKDRQTRMALRSLTDAVQALIAAEDRREDPPVEFPPRLTFEWFANEMKRLVPELTEDGMEELWVLARKQGRAAARAANLVESHKATTGQVGRRWVLTWKEGVGRRAEGPTVWPYERIEVMPVDEEGLLAHRVVKARAALSEYIVTVGEDCVHDLILRADAALKGVDTSADIGHTDGMDSNAGQED